jgi:hypothetical protein
MSRNTSNSQLALPQCIKIAAVSGCFASLLFPIFSTQLSYAATPNSGGFGSSAIESTAPGNPSDSSLDESPILEPESGEPINAPITLEDTRFSCLNRGGEYTVMYQPESRPGEGFPWAVPQAMGGGWSAESRCFEIARRLEEYRPDGLIELQTGRENGYNTLCVTSEDNPDCRIVLTVPTNRDPIATRNAVFDNLVVADTGEQTTGVSTYAGGAGDGLTGELVSLGSKIFGRRTQTLSSDRGAVRLKPFLDRADGGSATNLRNGIQLKSSQSNGAKGVKLNPDRFRQ